MNPPKQTFNDDRRYVEEWVQKTILHEAQGHPDAEGDVIVIQERVILQFVIKDGKVVGKT